MYYRLKTELKSMPIKWNNEKVILKYSINILRYFIFNTFYLDKLHKYINKKSMHMNQYLSKQAILF